MTPLGSARTLVLGALALAALALPASAGAAVAHKDISYDLGSPPADPNDNALDIYLPDQAQASDSRPVVVYVHGGGWATGDKNNQITRKVNLFTGAGFVFVSLNYRLSPMDENALAPGRVMFPDHPHDVGEALGWLSQNIAAYGGDPTRFVLSGHSAGAHLVALLSTDPQYAEAYGVEPWRIIGTVALDGDAYDVADRIAEVPPGSKNTFYNAFGTPEENAITGAWAAGSPLLFADPGDPRFLLVTQAGAPQRVADAQAFATALGQDASSVFAAPYDHAGINQAVGDPGDASGETEAIMSFISASVTASADPPSRLKRKPKKRVRTGAKKAQVEFKLGSAEAGVHFECRLDSKKLKPCDARERYRVGHGRHTFRYLALSARGRPGVERRYRFRVVGTG
jgi:acetyl esterase/lipase